MKTAQYSTTARTITLVISVLNMKSGLRPKTEFFINFTESITLSLSVAL